MILKKNNCKSCGAQIKPFLDFGNMPIANAFYNLEDYKKQYFYRMKVCFCKKCFCFQLLNIPKPKQMFHQKYAYFASTSKSMELHWKNLAKDLKNQNKNKKNKIIIDIGSNDGIFLKNFTNSKYWTPIGVEPSKNVANFSRKYGLKNIINDFFNYKLSLKILKKFRQKAQIITSTNTMHHIEDTNSVFKGVKNLLSEDGVFITEDPSLLEMIKKNSYDQIYAEHMYIWSAIALDQMAKKHGLFLYHIENNKVHGGCSRYFFCHDNKFKRSIKCNLHIKKELAMGLNKTKTYINFKDKSIHHSKKINQLIQKLKKNGKTICCYTAPAKGTTLLNFSKLDIKLIDKIFDNTNFKIGKYMPGNNKIPVYSTDEFRKEKYDYVLMLAWNHKKVILKKEHSYTKKIKAKWIIPMPHINIIN